MKICPKCRRPQDNPTHLGCEKCKVPFVDESELVTNFTRDELKIIAGFLLRNWRVYVVAGVFLAAGVGLLYWQAREGIKSQIEQFHITASNQIVAAYSTTTNQLTSKFQTFTRDASNQIALAYSSVTNQIAEEFQTPKIRQVVESVAKGEAKTILEAEVRPTVDSFRADAEFLRLATRARAYDFKAYLRLLEMRQLTNDLAKYAEGVVAETDRSLERDRSQFASIRTFMTYSGTNFYAGPFTSDELALRFSHIVEDKTSFNREGFVNTVGELKQPLFLHSLIELFTNETDLAVADRLTIAISQLAKEDFHPHDFERIQTWSRLHENDYTNWPRLALEKGIAAFSIANYSEAANFFDEVLSLDVSADLSRAHAIVCRWEAGETNKAIILAKKFKDPEARWAKWAAAKAELELGNVSNATFQVAFIATNFPGFGAIPKEGFHIWRKVDWQLFNRLTVKSTP